ncbi:hypothetical protein F2Q68_00015127 [Brassica cretica]|uniref:Uncharacterized protein n=1 Tax=Brassica cretica TaxID=69181 RepID=A0A8S9HG20_BRACR|nr:hypothetical protein F2Q68_00015127 [Brassica cretica]
MNRDVADPKRRLLQFDVQEICDNFEKGMMKALKDISKSHKKSTSTRAPVAEPSFFIVKNLKVFEEEPLDYPHQGPRLDTRNPLDEDLDPIFDEEDEPGPVFDEEATSITSIVMESHLCFDPGTTPAPLTHDLQEHCNGIKSEFILSFDQFLKHSKGFDRFEKSLELDLKQTDFCARKSFDSFVFKENGFDLSSSKHAMITDSLIASSCALDDFLIKKMLEQKSLETETNFCDLDLYVEQDMHDLKMNTIVAYLDKILFCNVYFDVHLERLKCVLLVLGKEILIFELNKYLSCTYDPGLFVFVLSIQERQVHPLRNESIDRAKQPEIWRSFFVQTGYLGDASDRGSVQNVYLNIQKVLCHESNFPGKPTHQGFTEAWNHLKIFTEEGVMNFPNRRFSSPSIREYQTSKGDSGPRKKRPEPKPILHEPMVFPQSTSCPTQKHYLAFSLSFPNRFTVWPNFKIDKPIFGDQFTCLMLAHVLDDYPKSLDPVFDVLMIEKPFEYRFIRFDVIIPTEVQAADRPRQTDRTVYRIDPRAAGEELRLEPRPDDRTHRTGARLPRPTRQAKTDGRARTHFDRVETETDNCKDSTTVQGLGTYWNQDDAWALPDRLSKRRLARPAPYHEGITWFRRTWTSKQTPLSVGLVSHIKQRFKIASLLDRSKQTPLSVGLVSHIKQRFKIASLLDRFGRAIRILEEVFHACDLRNCAGEELRSKACAENLAVHSGMTSSLVELAVGIILELVPGPGFLAALRACRRWLRWIRA